MALELKQFTCPHCKEKGTERVDEQYPSFSSERIQSSDDLNADPKSDILTKNELWYCLWCGQYFKAYYKLEKLTLLKESDN